MSPRPVLCPLCIGPVPISAQHAAAVHSDGVMGHTPVSPELAYALAQRIRLDDNLVRPERLYKEHTMGHMRVVNLDRCDLERPARPSDPHRIRSLTHEIARIIGAPYGRTVYEDLVLIARRWPDAPAGCRTAAQPALDDICGQLRAALCI